MKGVLSFELPEEQGEFDLASNALALSSVITEYDNYLRSMFKYQDETQISIEFARKTLWEIVAQNGVRDLFN